MNRGTEHSQSEPPETSALDWAVKHAATDQVFAEVEDAVETAAQSSDRDHDKFAWWFLLVAGLRLAGTTGLRQR